MLAVTARMTAFRFVSLHARGSRNIGASLDVRVRPGASDLIHQILHVRDLRFGGGFGHVRKFQRSLSGRVLLVHPGRSDILRALPRHLAYTLALDHPPGATGHRTMAKFLVLSLLRTRFSGDIVVFKNTREPLFMIPRAGVREVFIETEPPPGEDFWDYAQSWKFRVRHRLDVAGYEKVLFLDADCLALRSVDPLLSGDWDLAVYPEPGSHEIGRASCRERV